MFYFFTWQGSPVMQTSFSTSVKIFLFAVPPVAPFMGASDVGQGYTGPKNGRSGPGNQTLDPQKDRAARAGI